MNMFFDWWFATSLRLRQFCWAVWLLVLVTLIFLSLTHHEERDALIRLRASHHQQWAALYRLVDTTPFSEEKTLPFSTGFSVARRTTGFLASIRAGRRVGVENAVGSSAVGIYTAGRAQRQREPFFVKRGR